MQTAAHVDLGKQCFDPRAGLSLPDAVQRCMVGEILIDAKIKIEGARLKDDAEAPQRLTRFAADVVAEDADRSPARVEETADQREQRRLAGPV